MKVVHFSPRQFVDAIMGQKGATPVSFTSVTEPKLKKRGNPFAMPVAKVSEVNGMIGYNYENSVNNQSEREGGERDFTAEPRSWGTRIHPCVVEHGGEYYLTVKVERALTSPLYFDAKGNELSSEDVKPFLPSRGKSRQGVEKEVIHREYKISNIRNIRWNGARVELIPVSVPFTNEEAETVNA